MDRRETVIDIPGFAGTLTPIAKADPARTFLAFSEAGANQFRFTTFNAGAGVTTWGIGSGFNSEVHEITFAKWGEFVQADWFCLNVMGIAGTVTVWESWGVMPVEATPWTFRAEPWKGRPNALTRTSGSYDSVLLRGDLPLTFEEELRKVKGAIWQRLKEKTSSPATAPSPWTVRA